MKIAFLQANLSTLRGPMNRRSFLARSAAMTTLCGAAGLAANASGREASPVPQATPDALPNHLNPPGIRIAGIRMVPVVGGKYKVWTKKIGSGPVKVLLLHGGPGFTHDYLEAMESFLPQAGIEMYYYDQLGCRKLRHARRSLPLDPRPLHRRGGRGAPRPRSRQFVLFGHSWGGILAIEYALKYQQHLRGLVISNMTAGTQAYLKRTAALKQHAPSRTLARLNALEAKQDYDNPEYTKRS